MKKDVCGDCIFFGYKYINNKAGVPREVASICKNTFSHSWEYRSHTPASATREACRRYMKVSKKEGTFNAAM